MAVKTKNKGKAAPVFVPDGCNHLMSRKQVCAAMGGVAERTLDNLLTTGKFPRPDKYIGDLPRWSIRTFNAWVDGASAGQGGGSDGVGEQG